MENTDSGAEGQPHAGRDVLASSISMEQFVYVLRLKRARAREALTPEDETIISKHFEYLQAQLHEGRLILAGPCTDRAFGIVILRAESEREALEFMKNDPSVKLGVMSGELHPFRIALFGEVYDAAQKER